HWGSSARSAASTAAAARACPTPAATCRIRIRLEEVPSASRVGIGYVLDEELLPIGPPRDADHVEPHGPIQKSVARQVEGRRLGHILPLLRAHRVEGGALPSRRAELHLHEHDLILVARDEIDL